MSKKFSGKLREYLDNKILESIDGTNADILGILDRWYESYQKIITFLGTSSGIVLLYTGIHLLQLIPNSESEKQKVALILAENKIFLLSGVSCLIFAIIFMIICLITTYNWYKTGLRNILTNSRKKDYIECILEDDMQYSVISKSMVFWGNISLYTGIATGLCLAFGVTLYTFGIYKIFPHLI